MSRKKQIWYRKSSSSATLAESLKEIYEIQVIPADSRKIFDAAAQQFLRTFLLEVEKESPEFLRQIVSSGSHARIVGVIDAVHGPPASSAFDGQSVFSYLSTTASAKEVKKTIALAFEN